MTRGERRRSIRDLEHLRELYALAGDDERAYAVRLRILALAAAQSQCKQRAA